MEKEGHGEEGFDEPGGGKGNRGPQTTERERMRKSQEEFKTERKRRHARKGGKRSDKHLQGRSNAAVAVRKRRIDKKRKRKMCVGMLGRNSCS